MNRLYIAMYHYTRDLAHSRYPRIKGMDRPLFEKQLQFFKEHFSVVTMEDVLDAANGRRLPDNALMLTFDDGYIDNFTVAFPLLQKYRMQGSFFIPGKTFTEDRLLDVNKIHFILAAAETESVKQDLFDILNQYRSHYPELLPNEELYMQYGTANRFDSADVIFVKRILQTGIPEKLRRDAASILFEKYVGISETDFSRELYMNRDQIHCMRESGMFIGLHGYDHYWLGNLPPEQMEQDINRSLEVMDEFIDKNNWVMNYPYGSYNQHTIDYISDHGCKLALTTEVRIADLDTDSPYQIPRLDCNDFPPKSENYNKLL